MKIPFFDLKRQYKEISNQVESCVADIMQSAEYIEGGAVKKLEEEMAKYLDCQEVITCANGTDALRIALQAYGIKPGDEVITTPFSFFATAEAISQLGAIPVFADICEDNLNISPESIKDKITDKTKAILPVHIFGMPADMDEICKIAKDNNLVVIEDACQAIGADYNGKKTGTIGDAGCFSFYPTKNLGCFGDGGMISSNDEEFADRCRAIKNHASGNLGEKAAKYLEKKDTGIIGEKTNASGYMYDSLKYYNFFTGWNSRLDSIQAGIVLEKLPKLDGWNEKRRKIALKYNNAFKNLSVTIPKIDNGNTHSCVHQYCLLSEKKRELIDYLGEKEIGTGEFYPVPLHLQIAYAGGVNSPGYLSVVEDVCKKSVCLPVFPELTDEETDYIIDAVKEFFGR